MNEEDELLVPDDKNLEQELYVFVVLQASCWSSFSGLATAWHDIRGRSEEGDDVFWDVPAIGFANHVEKSMLICPQDDTRSAF